MAKDWFGWRDSGNACCIKKKGKMIGKRREKECESKNWMMKMMTFDD